MDTIYDQIISVLFNYYTTMKNTPAINSFFLINIFILTIVMC